MSSAARDEAARRKQEAAESNKERRKAFEENMRQMRERVESRPFLFEQAGINTAVERAKNEALDRFDDVLRKQGLAGQYGIADRLDVGGGGGGAPRGSSAPAEEA